MMPTWLAPAALKRWVQVMSHEQIFERAGREGKLHSNIETTVFFEWAAAGRLGLLLFSMQKRAFTDKKMKQLS